MCVVATVGDCGRMWSVVVLVVDEVGVAGVKPKSHAPIAADPDRPVTRQRTFEWMQVPARRLQSATPNQRRALPPRNAWAVAGSNPKAAMLAAGSVSMIANG